MSRPFDLRGFKKGYEDDKSATLIHPKGHEIRIAKHALDDVTKKALKALPFAEGGEVKKEPPHFDNGGVVGEVRPFSHDPSLESSTPDVEYRNGVPQVKGKGNLVNGSANSYGQTKKEANSHPPEKLSEGGEAGSKSRAMDKLDEQLATMGQPGMDSQEALGQPSVTGIPAPQPPTEDPAAPQTDAPDQGPATMPQAMAPQAAMPQPGVPGAGMMQQGMKQEAQAMGDLGQQQAGVYQNLDQHLGDLDRTYQAHDAELHKEYQSIHKDYVDGHVDPNNLWKHKSTGAKVATGLGIILSGLGSGMAHQENLALKVLHKAIDEDIDAQKTNLGKQHSLLQDNLQRTRDLQTAHQLTKAQLLTVAEAQLKKAAANAATPIAKAQYLQKAGALQMQIGQLGQQVAQRTAISDAISRGGLQNPQIMGLAVQTFIPQHQQAEAFKQLKVAQDVKAQEANIMGSFDQAANENTALGRAGRLGYEPPSIKAINHQVMGPLKDIEGRVNETEIHVIQQLAPAVGDSDKTIRTKRLGLQKFLQSKVQSPLLNMIPGYQQAAGQSSQPANAINFTPAR